MEYEDFVINDKNEFTSTSPYEEKTENQSGSDDEDEYVDENTMGIKMNKMKEEDKVIRKLHPYNPKAYFRVVHPGLNLHCYC